VTAPTLTLMLLLSSPGHALAAPAPSAQTQKVNAEAKLLADFQKAVQSYSAMHRKLEATIPDLPKEATPEQIERHQTALAELITHERSQARAGDIFTRSTRAQFRRFLAQAFAGPDGPELKAAIMEENPGNIRFAVNGRYPDAVPVGSVPPKVLQALPKLPEDLEYRFIADTLILLDIHAHIIVDLIEKAIPR
jgi:hypothetical protein